MAARRGLLIELDYCSGCRACILACQAEHGHPPDRGGMEVIQRGPRPRHDGGWTFDFLPTPTPRCSLCRARAVAGRIPFCVAHCPTRCLHYLPDDESVDRAAARSQDNPRLVLVRR